MTPVEAVVPVESPTGPRALRLGEWPILDDRALAEERRTLFQQRKLAVEAYARGESLNRIEQDCGVHRSTVLRLARQGQRAHPDGRLWGYRALVPHVRVQPYERSKAPRVLVHETAGNAGTFAQLLQRHPSLASQLRRELEVANVVLQAGEPGCLKGVKGAAARFHQACRDLGLGAGDYPLNQKDMAIRSLGRTLRAWMQDDFDLAARAAVRRATISTMRSTHVHRREHAARAANRCWPLILWT